MPSGLLQGGSDRGEKTTLDRDVPALGSEIPARRLTQERVPTGVERDDERAVNRFEVVGHKSSDVVGRELHLASYLLIRAQFAGDSDGGFELLKLLRSELAGFDGMHDDGSFWAA